MAWAENHEERQRQPQRDRVRRNSRIADIANVLLTFDIEIVNFRLQAVRTWAAGA